MNDEQLDQSESEDVAGGVTFHASSTNHRPAFRVKCDAALPLKDGGADIIIIIWNIFI